MDSREFIAKAYDSNAFTTSQTSAGYINPEIWNKEVLSHVEQNLVVAKLGKVYTDLLNKPGDTLNITVGVEPTSASTVTESTSSPVNAYTKTQVVFTPTERSVTYQLTNKEKSRAFIPLMQDMTAELGYALALLKDNLVIALLQASAGNSVVANGVDSSAIASSDTISHTDIVNAKTELHIDKLNPYALVLGYEQLADLEVTQAAKESNLGDTISKNGFVGRFAGLDVYVTQGITGSSNSIKALVLARDNTGKPPFGIAVKANPYIETEYHARERYTDIVATEDYDYKILRENGICTIESYSATA
jgi:hypothetical protein